MMKPLAILSTVLALTACSGLPKGGGGPPSYALKNNNGTALAAAVRPRLDGHAGQSGLHALADPHDALAARLALADAAQRSLDVQYYIWNKDMVGRVMLQRLFRAADRGVRVRLLLDDVGTRPSDKALLAIDSHPKIEVRMFNPVAMRSLRTLGLVTDFTRVNKRMHNKSFTADGQVSIVGGRNIGDEYYGAHQEANFADLDVAVIGPAVKQVSDEFDLYWNHAAAVPISTLSQQNTTSEQFAERRAELVAQGATERRGDYVSSVRGSEFARQIRNRSTAFDWGRATIATDHPDKVLTSSADTATHLAPQLREVVNRTKRELFLVSPYFVPGKEGVAFLAAAHKRGPRVIVITNSLASTDGLPVHAGYQRYRKALLQAGIELYEMKPTANAAASRGTGSSSASLHAKTFAFDRRDGFIGSYNLDPRSSRLNMEMGVLFDCPALARRLPLETERDLERNAYRVELTDNHLTWTTREGDKVVRYDSEPGGWWKKTKVAIFSCLPIEGLL